jgi:hypothetical protein
MQNIKEEMKSQGTKQGIDDNQDVTLRKKKNPAAKKRRNSCSDSSEEELKASEIKSKPKIKKVLKKDGDDSNFTLTREKIKKEISQDGTNANLLLLG